MKPAPFDYLRAETLAEAHDVLAAEGGDAAVIAGGQSLVPLLSMRMARPKVLLDIMHLAELRGIRVENDAIRVGARVRQAELLAWPELANISRCSRRRCHGSGIGRRARAARCAARSRWPIRAPKCRWCSLALGGRVTLSSSKGRRK